MTVSDGSRIIQAMTIKPTPFFIVKRGAPDTRVKYPFDQLQVGHYFDAPRELDHAVRVQASRHGKRHGRRYRVQRMDSERVRVYRIA